MHYLSVEKIIEEFNEKFIGIDFWQQFPSAGTKSTELIQPFLDFLLAQRQKDREVLAETVGELKLQYHCAKCDGARLMGHSQACKAITDAVFFIRDSWKK